MRRCISCIVLISTLLMLVSCGNKNSTEKSGSEHSIALMTDTGGINDQAFNQSAWEGAQKAKEDFGIDIRYIESKQVADYKENINSLLENKPDMVVVMGYTAADTLLDVANANKDQNFTIIDYKLNTIVDNIYSVSFRDCEGAFLVGYIAGYTTKTGKVGFIGGAKSDTIDEFEYGYRAGVKFAALELKKNIDVEVQYAGNFQDDTKGKAMANGMYSNGVDIIYHAAGNLGKGVIEAAKDNNKWVIGADKDQKYLAPKNVISSTLKLTKEIVYQICEEIHKNGNANSLIGKNISVGLKEKAVDIAESTKDMISEELMKKVNIVKDDIISGKIIPPYSEQTFIDFENNKK